MPLTVEKRAKNNEILKMGVFPLFLRSTLIQNLHIFSQKSGHVSFVLLRRPKKLEITKAQFPRYFKMDGKTDQGEDENTPTRVITMNLSVPGVQNTDFFGL